MQNLPGINTQDALGRLMNNEKLLQKLLASFLRDYATYTDQIGIDLENNNIEAVRHQLHTLKGVAANLSMPELFEAVKTAEQAAIAGSLTSEMLLVPKAKLDEIILGLRAAGI